VNTGTLSTISHDSGKSKDSRVTVRLCSGLGNQLFQFTCGLAEQRRLGAALYFDTTWYDLVAWLHSPIRRLRLRDFGLPIEEAFRGWRRWLVGLAAAAFDRTNHGRAVLELASGMSVVQESQPLHRQMVANAEVIQPIYLNGYWQTADHFLTVRGDLKRMLVPRSPLSDGASSWITRVRGRKTGFIHIRRGDYTALVGDAGLLPVDYYKRATSLVEREGGRLCWIIFAEDEQWARTNMVFLHDWEVVSYESSNRDIEDLLIMKDCAAGIIANSSYSWWGAAIGDCQDRPIIAPDRYWKRADATTDEWILPRWTQVQGWH
jgi:hypothetical protein